MLNYIEDSVYAALDSFNSPLLLYSMHDYEELIKYSLHFDSLEKVNKHKIQPDDTGLI
jgi:hypothetical protein